MRRVLWFLVASVMVAGSVAAQVPIITTVARDLEYLAGVTVDRDGTLLVTNDCTVERVDLVTGRVTTVAGSDATVAGSDDYAFCGRFCGDGGPATSACLGQVLNVAVDAIGNLYLADYINSRVRKVDPAGIISTVAGNGVESFCGDDGPATSACVSRPRGVAVDTAGNLYIAQPDNHRIRKVTAATGIITTVAGNGTRGYCGDGGPATSACLRGPGDVVVDTSGNLYIADLLNVRKVDAETGIITTVAGSGSWDFCGDGGPATSACFLVAGLGMDGAGNLYIADPRNNRIRKVNAAGTIRTVAGRGPADFGRFCGDGGLAVNACLAYPVDVTLDGFGNLYIADADNSRIRKVAGPLGDVPVLRLTKTTVPGCFATRGQVALAFPARAGGLTVTLGSDSPHAVVPDSLFFKAGALTQYFPILTTPVATGEAVQISAGASGHAMSATLTLEPMRPKAVDLAPNPVAAGTAVAGQVTLECPAGPGDIEVRLTSTKPLIAAPTPASVTVPVGMTLMPFTVTTNPVTVVTRPAIKATANGVTKSKTLVVNPAP